MLDRLQEGLEGGRGLFAALTKNPAVVQAVIGTALATPATQRDTFAFLRAVQPLLTLPFNIVRAYEGTGTLLVTRAADVAEVLHREADFAVVYGPRMRKLTGGRDFFLGVQDGPLYRRDTAAMRSIVKPGDLNSIAAMARAEAQAAVAAAGTAGGGTMDLVAAIGARIPALMVQRHFGIDGGLSLPQLIADATILFFYLFSDLTADARVEAGAMAAKDRVNAAIDASVATAGPGTLLGRAVAQGAAGDPAFDADGLRTQMIGILIGAVATLNKAAVNAVEELLARPAILARARAAVAAGDESRVAGFLWEALRFAPNQPFLYRRAVRDTLLAGEPVPAGRMVLAATLSAMHDRAAVKDPGVFRANRAWKTYQLWGDGLHRCWGDAINRAILPAMLAPVLALPALRSVASPDGGGTPFPKAYSLAWG
jgi:cytochrome P450